MEIQIIYNELFNNGFYKINDPSMFQYLIDIESWEWKNWKEQGLQLIKRNDTIEKNIKLTQIIIAEKYIKQLDKNFKYGEDCEIVNGMDDATLSWHNDNIEGYNLCVLLYCDSMDKDIGGKIKFRDMISKKILGGFYPQKYDICLMNHCLRFEHIVTPLKLPLNRRVASFNYNIENFLLG